MADSGPIILAARKTHAADAGLTVKPKVVTASAFRLTELPVEILEQILLHLPGQDVVKMEVVGCVIAIPHDSALTFR